MGPSILSAEGIREVRMIEDVEEFYAELRTKMLAPLEVLGDGKIHVLESRIAEDIASHGAERAEYRRN